MRNNVKTLFLMFGIFTSKGEKDRLSMLVSYKILSTIHVKTEKGDCISSTNFICYVIF